MEKTGTITLIGVKRHQDDRRQWVEEELSGREVFCSVASATRAEWAAVGQQGVKPSAVVTVWADEYNGELTAVYDGKRYRVYRTFQPNPEEIELYLEKKGGV